MNICDPQQYCLANLLSFERFHCFQETSSQNLICIHCSGVVPCDGRKMTLRTSSIMLFIFYVLSFEISGHILRNQKNIILE